jgi:hypothetical protein
VYNTLAAAGIAVVAFVLGFLAAGWIAGIVPAILAFGIAWALLARRSMRAIQVLQPKLAEAMQQQQFDEARRLLEGALPVGKWQFLVTEQIHLQLGSIDYLQAAMLKMQRQITASQTALANARGHFVIASPARWWAGLLGWQGRAMLACVLYRQGDTAAGIEQLKLGAKAQGALVGKPDPMFWGLYAWMLNEAHKRDEALQVVAKGLQDHPKAKGLVEMQEAMSNRKRPSMMVWGESWYQFFPEAMADDPKVIELARAQAQRQQQQGHRPPPPRALPKPRR